MVTGAERRRAGASRYAVGAGDKRPVLDTIRKVQVRCSLVGHIKLLTRLMRYLGWRTGAIRGGAVGLPRCARSRVRWGDTAARKARRRGRIATPWRALPRPAPPFMPAPYRARWLKRRWDARPATLARWDLASWLKCVDAIGVSLAGRLVNGCSRAN